MYSVECIIYVYFDLNISLGTTNDFILPKYFIYVPFVDRNPCKSHQCECYVTILLYARQV